MRLRCDARNALSSRARVRAPLHPIGEHIVTDVLRFVLDLEFKLHADAL